MSKYVAHYKDSRQISMDDFEVYTKMLECDEQTKLKEIFEWMLKHNKSRRCITITQPEKQI